MLLSPGSEQTFLTRSKHLIKLSTNAEDEIKKDALSSSEFLLDGAISRLVEMPPV